MTLITQEEILKIDWSGVSKPEKRNCLECGAEFICRDSSVQRLCHGCKHLQPRRARLAHYYGMKLSDFRAMEKAQGGVCAICSKPPVGRRRLVVDHDHKSGVVRGLLCNTCNTALGMFGDDPERMRVAAAYVSRTLNTLQ